MQKKMWSIIFPLKESYNKMITIMNAVIQRSITEKETHKCEVLKILVSHMSKLENYLQPIKTKLKFPQIQVFKTFRLFCLIDQDDVREQILFGKFAQFVTTLFFKFSNHTIFHSEFYSFIVQLVTAEQPKFYGLLKKLFSSPSVRLLEQIMHQHKVERLKPIPLRAGYFGYLTQISVTLQEAAANDCQIQALLDNHKDWKRFVEGPLAATLKIETVPEGIKPQRDSNATFSLKADEVPADIQEDGSGSEEDL